LARAKQPRAYDSAADLATLAASYGHGLCRSHPFNDGNKRIAFVTMSVFLGLNGQEIDAPETEVVEVMMSLAASELPRMSWRCGCARAWFPPPLLRPALTRVHNPQPPKAGVRLRHSLAARSTPVALASRTACA